MVKWADGCCGIRVFLSVRLWLILLLAVFLASGRGTVLAQPVDLELVLAVDVSNSVDDVEAAWQRQGYVEALSNPDVVAMIRNGPHGRIAVMLVEWAGTGHQVVAVDWMVIHDRASAREFSQKIARAPSTRAPYTSISAMIDFARLEFRRNQYQGLRRIIDISGDGPNSTGRAVRQARDDAVKEGITINGLPILSIRPNPEGGSPISGLDSYYRDNVIGGPGAFLIEASMLDRFSDALVNKLLREIRGEDQPNVAAVQTGG